VRAPIIRAGDDIAKIVADSVLSAADSEGIQIRDRDVVAVTEAVVAPRTATTIRTGASIFKAKILSGVWSMDVNISAPKYTISATIAPDIIANNNAPLKT
ncbi:MAG: coenzyme F420-0:L-glutamate ligase, partial [Agathobacter sp.]|nr:coenzyme F420-0:L-glutamate ligase [Agathobacter sp.]